MPEEQEKQENRPASEMIYCPDCHGDSFLEDGSVCQNCAGGGVFLRVRGAGDYYWGQEIQGNLSFSRS